MWEERKHPGLWARPNGHGYVCSGYLY